MAEENGEEKLIAVARHIAKTLGHSDSTADDILHIFSNFDNRFRQTLTANLTADDPLQSLKSLDRRITNLLDNINGPIWGDADNVKEFLRCVDGLIPLVEEGTGPRGAELVNIVMFRLQEEFKMLMNVGSRKFDGFEDDIEEEEDDDDEDVDIVGEDFISHRFPGKCLFP